MKVQKNFEKKKKPHTWFSPNILGQISGSGLMSVQTYISDFFAVDVFGK